MKLTSIIAVLAFATAAAATEPTAATAAPTATPANTTAAPVKMAKADSKKEEVAPVSGDATKAPAKKGKKKAAKK